MERLRGFGSANRESLAQLVWAFFEYWAWGHNYSQDVVSVRVGGVLHKDDKDWTRRIGNERHLVRGHAARAPPLGRTFGSTARLAQPLCLAWGRQRRVRSAADARGGCVVQVCIEDPFELSHDLGRTVDRQTRAVLHKEFTRAATLLRDAQDPLDLLFEPYRVGARAAA